MLRLSFRRSKNVGSGPRVVGLIGPMNCMRHFRMAKKMSGRPANRKPPSCEIRPNPLAFGCGDGDQREFWQIAGNEQMDRR